MKKNDKWVYIVPAIKQFGLEVEDMMVRTSFTGGHRPGVSDDDGMDQGGGHGVGDVEEDEGD